MTTRDHLSKFNATRALRTTLGLLIVLGYLMLISACTSVPNVDEVVAAQAQDSKTTPTINGARGPLSRQQTKAILDKLKHDSPDTDILQSQIALMEGIADTPLAAGNKVTLIQDGPATYKAEFAAIRNAKDNINLETFTIEDDEVGKQFADLLIEEQSKGVQVSLIYDSAGSFGTPQAFFDRLTESGIQVLEFNPINPLRVKKGWQFKHRDHRKLLVVDGETVFTGGINISNVYSGGSFGRPVKKKEGVKKDPWRDTHVQIEGPVTADFQKLFLETWEKQKGEPLSPRNYFPALTKKGNDVVRAIGSSPADAEYSLIYITVVSAINNADNSIHLTTAYFAPDVQLLDALKEAARRGVDVKIILPGHTDSWAAFNVGRSHYSDLLEAGVKIYERRNALLHAKTAVIDGVWSTVGSSNLDWLSFSSNDEVNAVVLGPEFGTQMETMFEEDLKACEPIDQERWEHRPLTSRIKEWAARVLQNGL